METKLVVALIAFSGVLTTAIVQYCWDCVVRKQKGCSKRGLKPTSIS
jgi:hypothetical protein